MQKNYAVMAKVKAMYGKRLTPENYEELLQKKTVGEIASYLKRDTAYGDLLAEVREELVHRGQLESLLRRRKLDIYLRLAKYSHSNDTFLRLFIMNSETDQLLLAIRLIGTRLAEKPTANVPLYLAKYMCFDLFSLATVKTFGELLALLEHTPYYDDLKPFRREKDLSACETALLTGYYRRALALVKQRYRGEAEKLLREHLLSQAALYNLVAIYRMKRFFDYPPEEIQKRLIDVEPVIGGKMYDTLIHSSDASTVLVRLKNIPMLQHFLRDRQQDIELVMERYQLQSSRKAFRFTTQPILVLLNYMAMLDIEISNLTNIIEGARYRLPTEDVRSLLVI